MRTLPVINQSSFKIWEGPSKYDGSEIAAILTNVGRPSKNPKTGPMSQLWILPKNEVPWKATKYEGGDDGICGDCIYTPLRAKRARENGHQIPMCYVGRRAYSAPSNSWKGSINRPVELELGLAALEASGAPLRFGSYGDPAMLPNWLIERLYKASATASLKRHTAYTHQQHKPWAQHLKKFAMASVNNDTDGVVYRQLGWRTFRITDGPEAGPDEIICPNYTHKVQCIKCGLCDGKKNNQDKRKSITIPRH